MVFRCLKAHHTPWTLATFWVGEYKLGESADIFADKLFPPVR
mgnify:CR=1 FL=1